jgi:hypothetical protein
MINIIGNIIRGGVGGVATESEVLWEDDLTVFWEDDASILWE